MVGQQGNLLGESRGEDVHVWDSPFGQLARELINNDQHDVTGRVVLGIKVGRG